MPYTIGYNMTGYIPEMEPYDVDTPEDARGAMLDELSRLADHLSDTADVCNTPGDWDNLAQVEALLVELRDAEVSKGWHGFCDGVHYWIEPNRVPA